MSLIFNVLLRERLDPSIIIYYYYSLEKGEDPEQVKLFHSEFWVQVHDLPSDYMSKVVV